MEFEKPSLCIKLVKGRSIIGVRAYLDKLSFSDMINRTMELIAYYVACLDRYCGTNDALFAMLFFHMTAKYVKAWDECYMMPEKSLELFKKEMDDVDILENVKNVNTNSIVALSNSDMMQLFVSGRKIITIDLDAKSVRFDKNMFMNLRVIEYAEYFKLNPKSIDLNTFPIISMNYEIPLEKAHEVFYIFKTNLQGFKTNDDAESIWVPIPQRA